MQKTVSLTVNGKPASATVEGRTLLVQLLREQLGLTGTHVGCDTSQCGACVVHVNGEAVKSCTLLAVQAEGCNGPTIEGVANGDTMHPIPEAFRNNTAPQCAFCTPTGRATYTLRSRPPPTARPASAGSPPAPPNRRPGSSRCSPGRTWRPRGSAACLVAG